MSELVCLENKTLSVAVDPDHGGRIVRFTDRRFGFEHAWYDASRLPVNPALDYDGNFAGGFDELLPNDVPRSRRALDFAAERSEGRNENRAGRCAARLRTDVFADDVAFRKHADFGI